MSQQPFRVTFDPEADAAFLYLVDEIGWGEATKSTLLPIEVKGSSVVISQDDTGRALGIEFLGASKLFTREMLDVLAASTEWPDRPTSIDDGR